MEDLAIDMLHPRIEELIGMGAVEGTCEDLEMREMSKRQLDDLVGLLAVIDGDDEDPGIGSACSMQKIFTRGIAIEDLEAELTQRINLLGIVIEHGRARAIGRKYAPDRHAEPAMPQDDHRRTGLVDPVGFALEAQAFE